jgi:hypothetical protein
MSEFLLLFQSFKLDGGLPLSTLRLPHIIKLFKPLFKTPLCFIPIILVPENRV